MIAYYWFKCGATSLGVTGFFFGIFTALWPVRSIRLYIWLMARINWRVSPIDEAREVSTTRIFGILIAVLNAFWVAAILNFSLRNV